MIFVVFDFCCLRFFTFKRILQILFVYMDEFCGACFANKKTTTDRQPKSLYLCNLKEFVDVTRKANVPLILAQPNHEDTTESTISLSKQTKVFVFWRCCFIFFC